jgi:hypothetical protein
MCEDESVSANAHVPANINSFSRFYPAEREDLRVVTNTYATAHTHAAEDDRGRCYLNVSAYLDRVSRTD